MGEFAIGGSFYGLHWSKPLIGYQHIVGLATEPSSLVIYASKPLLSVLSLYFLSPFSFSTLLVLFSSLFSLLLLIIGHSYHTLYLPLSHLSTLDPPEHPPPP